MKLILENWREYLDENAKRSTAVIIKGNPDYISDHNDFYEEIKSFLEGLGYEVSFDEGAPRTSPPKADLWIGHSRGSDRLEGATPEYAKAALAIGVPDPTNQPFPAINHPDDQPEVGKEPSKWHFVFTDEMKNKIKEISNETNP
tara:strand:+ start:279 stop:710 length:432 start_codon:yes stop_codon:yes gene_type:complete